MKLYDIRAADTPSRSATKRIFLSTLHSAKGLEYEKVIIKNITEKRMGEEESLTQVFTLPDTLSGR